MFVILKIKVLFIRIYSFDILNSRNRAKMHVIEIKLTYTFIDHGIEVKRRTILYLYTEVIYVDLVCNNRDEKLLPHLCRVKTCGGRPPSPSAIYRIYRLEENVKFHRLYRLYVLHLACRVSLTDRAICIHFSRPDHYYKSVSEPLKI